MLYYNQLKTSKTSQVKFIHESEFGDTMYESDIFEYFVISF